MNNHQGGSFIQSFMGKFKTIILCLLFLGFLNSNSGQSSVKIQKRELKTLNPTSHIFRLPLTTLQDTLQVLFNFIPQMNNRYLMQVFYHQSKEDSVQAFFHIETSKDSSYTYGELVYYFTNPNNENDVIIDSYTRAWDSPIYHDRAKSLPFRSPFLSKFKSIDDNHTLLTIEALYPEVYIYPFYWEQCRMCGIDVMDLRTKKVQATTIEEHALLQYIADKLGDSTVEPLKLPALIKK